MNRGSGHVTVWAAETAEDGTVVREYDDTPDGFGTSELAQNVLKILAPPKKSKPGLAATARNWATATKLLSLCAEK